MLGYQVECNASRGGGGEREEREEKEKEKEKEDERDFIRKRCPYGVKLAGGREGNAARLRPAQSDRTHRRPGPPNSRMRLRPSALARALARASRLSLGTRRTWRRCRIRLPASTHNTSIAALVCCLCARSHTRTHIRPHKNTYKDR